MEDIAIAILEGSQDHLRGLLAENVILHLADGTLVEGSEAANLYITKQIRRSFDILKIDHAITHGRVGSANGLVTVNGQKIGFCVVVDFVNTKADRLKAIKLYGL